MYLKRILFFASAFSVLTACGPQEGKGGLASIEGTVMVQDLNTLHEKSGELYPATDEEVFISYGNSELADDKAKTSFNGKYKFSNITKGDYTLFVYSDDTTSNAKNATLTFKQNVSLDSKKDAATLETFIIYNHVDYDDGNGIVSGNVQEIQCKGGIEQDTLNATNADVFLQFQNGSEILERVRTDANGDFIIPNLIPGKYRLYCLTETRFDWQSDTAVVRNFEIESNSSKIVVKTIYTRNY